MQPRLRTLLACGAFAARLTAQEPRATPPVQSPLAQTFSNAGPDYVFGPGDDLLIHVLDLEEMPDRPVRVDSHGDLNLPIAGSVHAAGLTASQLEEIFKTRLRRVLKDPQITITLADPRDEPYTVLGAVVSPGLRQAHGSKTLADALSEAGGLRADAGPVVKIIRLFSAGPIPLSGNRLDPNGKVYSAEVELSAFVRSQNPGENIVLRAHDIVSVPPAETIYVLGEVARPGAYELSGKRELPVLSALAQAGGTNRMAGLSRARVLRATAGKTERTEFVVDLNRMLSGKESEFQLAPHDILYIPTNRGKVATMRAIEAMIGAGSSITVFRSSR